MKNENIELIISFYRKSFLTYDWKLEKYPKRNGQDIINYLKDNRFKMALFITIAIVIILQTLIVSEFYRNSIK